MKRFLAIILTVTALFPLTSFASFSFYRTITVDKTKVSGSVSTTTGIAVLNFPVLIDGIYSYLANVANGGKVQSANFAYDVGFYTNSDCSTGKMNWEQEKHATSTGTVDYWVKSSLSTTTDTVFYMCYGDSSIVTDQSSATSVWDSNFKGVWHLKENTGATNVDSTSNPNDGTPTSVTATASGKINGAQSFNGTTSVINNGSDASIDNLKASGGVTLSAWINPTSMGEGNNGVIVGKIESGTGWNWRFLTGTTNALSFRHIGSTNLIRTISNSLVTLSAWNHVQVTWNGSVTAANVKMYINGVEATYQTTTNGATLASDAAESFRIGNQGLADDTFAGTIDEVHASNVIRNTDWITTEYNNQNATSTFYAIGNETSVSVAGIFPRMIIFAKMIIYGALKI